MGKGNYASTFGYRPVPFRRRRPNFYKKRGAPLRRGPRVGPRYRRRNGAGAMTATKKRQSRLGQAHKTGDNSSISATHIGWARRVSKMLLNKLMGHNIIQNNDSGYSVSGQGRQKLLNLRFLDRTDLEAIKVAANAGVTTENDVSLFLKSCKMRVHLRNQSNSLAKALIYDISTFNSGYSATIDTPGEAWDFGFSDMGTTNQSERVGATPFASAEFRKGYRINKVTYVPLEAGQQHEHTVTKHMNWFVNSTKWANTAAQNVRGLTHFVMVVWHGCLAHDNTPGTSITYTPVRMDYATFKQYNFAYLSNNKPTYTLTDNLPTTLVDLDMMGENQDADVDPANA